jgi:large conductance mechanosensitive channel
VPIGLSAAEQQAYLNSNYYDFSWGDIKMSMMKEFLEFLREYKVIALAVAFIMAVAATALVKSLVDNIIMPVITAFIPGGAWKTSTFALGPIVVGWGPFLGELINFTIIAFVVFVIAKKVMKEEKVGKK